MTSMGDAGSAPKLASEEARLAREAASIKKAEDKKAKEAARGRERWAKKKLLAKEFKFKPLLPPNYRAGRIGVRVDPTNWAEVEKANSESARWVDQMKEKEAAKRAANAAAEAAEAAEASAAAEAAAAASAAATAEKMARLDSSSRARVRPRPARSAAARPPSARRRRGSAAAR